MAGVPRLEAVTADGESAARKLLDGSPGPCRAGRATSIPKLATTAQSSRKVTSYLRTFSILSLALRSAGAGSRAEVGRHHLVAHLVLGQAQQRHQLCLVSWGAGTSP